MFRARVSTGIFTIGLALLGVLLCDVRPVAAEPKDAANPAATSSSAATASPAAAADSKPAAKPAAAKSEKGKKRFGRLPQYYREIVTEEQRAKIVEIQEQFGPKIDSLRQQIDALTKERDAKVVGVLTPDQKKKLDERIAAAKSARETKAAAKAKGKEPANGKRADDKAKPKKAQGGDPQQKSDATKDAKPAA
jgi:Spy/CpxP family protein refolding chaperone